MRMQAVKSDQQEGFLKYDYSFLSLLLVFGEPKADVKMLRPCSASSLDSCGSDACCSYGLFSFLGHPAQFYMWFLGCVFQPHSICRAPTEMIPFLLSGSSESTHPEERSLWKDYVIKPPVALSQIRLQLLFFSSCNLKIERERVFAPSHSVAFSQGSLSCGGLIPKTCRLINLQSAEETFPDGQRRELWADILCLCLLDNINTVPDEHVCMCFD